MREEEEKVMDRGMHQIDIGRMLDTLRIFDQWFDVEHQSVPVILPTVMLVVLPPFIPVPVPVPTTVALPVPVVRLRPPKQPAQAAQDGATIPLEVVPDET
jgi:hypothetical protein